MDTKVHFRIPFGLYAQVSTKNGPTNNALISQTVSAISLGPTGNVQGTYKFMSLLTGLLFRSRSFVMLHMPSEVIKQVVVFAKDQPRDVIFADRVGRAAIGDLSTEEDESDNDDGRDRYDSDEEASRDENEESLHFDEDIGEGDLEITKVAENIFPNSPVTMGLHSCQLGRI